MLIFWKFEIYILIIKQQLFLTYNKKLYIK